MYLTAEGTCMAPMTVSAGMPIASMIMMSGSKGFAP